MEADVGQGLVSTALGFFICSRIGLTEEELATLLNYNRPVSRRVPSMALTFFLRSFEAYLTVVDTRTGARAFSHGVFVTAIQSRYFADTTAGKVLMTAHRFMANVLLARLDPYNNRTWTGSDRRALSEILYHFEKGHMWVELREALCNLHFVQACCAAGLGTDILSSYTQGTTSRDLKKILVCAPVQQYASFVSRNLHILLEKPVLTIQQASADPGTTAPAVQANTIFLSQSHPPRGLISWLNKPTSVDACTLTLNGFLDSITCVALSVDGTMLVCGSSTGVVRLYVTNTGALLACLAGHGTAISAVAFTGPDRVCTASWDSKMILWDCKTYLPIASLKGHTRRITTIVPDPRGKTILSGSWDCSLRLFNAKDGSNMTEFYWAKSPINTATFHPEGQLAAAGYWNGQIKIFDTFNKKVMADLHNDSKYSIRSLTWSANGIHIASVALDGCIRLWSTVTYEAVGVFPLGHASPVNECVFSPSGAELVTVADDCKVKVWGGQLGKLRLMWEAKELGSATCVAYNTAGTTLAVGYHECVTQLRSVDSGLHSSTLLATLKGHVGAVTTVQWSSSMDVIATASRDSTVRFYDSHNGICQGRLVGHSKAVFALAFHPNRSSILVTASEDFSVMVWSIGSADLEVPSAGDIKDNSPCYKPILTCTDHLNSVTAVKFSGSGSYLFSAGRDGAVIMYDSSTPTKLRKVLHHVCHADWINFVDVNHTGSRVLTASNDFLVKLWSASTSKMAVLATLTGHVSAVNSAIFSPPLDGKIISTSTDGSVKIWSMDGAEITSLGDCHRANAVACMVLPDGANTLTVTVACGDGSVRICEPYVGTVRQTFLGHSDRVVGTALGPNNLLVTCGLDASIRFWNKSSVPVSTENAHCNAVVSVSFVEDGSVCAVGDRGGFVSIWYRADSFETRGTIAGDYIFQGIFSLGVMAINGIVILQADRLADMYFCTASNNGVLAKWLFRNNAVRLVKEQQFVGHKQITCPQGHEMIFEDCKLPGYENGYYCDGGVTGNGCNVLKTGVRYVCSGCQSDCCQACAKELFQLKSVPLTSLTWSGPAEHLLVVGTWQGSVHVVDSTDLTLIQTVVLPGPTDWVCSVQFADSRIFASSMNGRLSSITGWESKNDLTVDTHNIVTATVNYWMTTGLYITEESRNIPRGVTWIGGDNLGKVSLFTHGVFVMSQQIHSKAITGMYWGVESSTLYTISLDNTLKVWTLTEQSVDGAAELVLIQVGEFVTRAPCLSVCVSRNVVVLGDQLGSVYVLNTPGLFD